MNRLSPNADSVKDNPAWVTFTEASVGTLRSQMMSFSHVSGLKLIIHVIEFSHHRFYCLVSSWCLFIWTQPAGISSCRARQLILHRRLWFWLEWESPLFLRLACWLPPAMFVTAHFTQPYIWSTVRSSEPKRSLVSCG